MTDDTSTPGRRIGLALAGGGAEGAVYEIGALRALEEAVAGIDFTRLHIYVGVSAGAFVCANLANGVTPSEMCRSIVEDPLAAENFLTPAFREFFRRGLRVPGLLLDALLHSAVDPREQLLAKSVTRFARALPVAIFDNEPIRRYLEKVFTSRGKTNDFRELPRRLVVVAAELDSGQAVCFGTPGRDHVPISRAVQASAALPGLYPPVLIDGRHYVDGVLLKTLHASVALEADADLVLCVNPIVPVDTTRADRDDALASEHGSDLTALGLPVVLSQVFRTLIHSRLTVGLAAYTPRYPDRDIVLFEPERDDYRMFFTNVFSFASRKAVCEHAYHVTRRDLLLRHDELAPVLARHGLALRRDVLLDARRTVWDDVGLTPPNGSRLPVALSLDRTLDRLEALLSRPDVTSAAAARGKGGEGDGET